jgi:hypothetical protein
MRLAYYDETGDDGFPATSSPLFVLSVVYLHYLKWQPAFEMIRDFRRHLKAAFGIPIQWELHTRHLLLNKKPYGALALPDSDRVNIIGLCCDLLASLDVKVISVVIVKPRIQNPAYQVLDRALTYSIRRIENDLDPSRNPQERFLIITDPGRVGTMQTTTRRVQRINYIPSQFSPQAYRREIRSLIEDPLPKDSRESYFIQFADLVSYVTYLYALHDTGTGALATRMPPEVDQNQVVQWMERLKPSLNLKASANAYGIVYHPK